MIQQKITEIAEILGWSVDFSEPHNGSIDVNFAKYTSYGQDFNFSVELEDDYRLCRNILNERFDWRKYLSTRSYFGRDLCVTPLHASYGQIGYTIHFPYSRDPMPELAYDWELNDLTIDEEEWQKWLAPDDDEEDDDSDDTTTLE